ncbi:hypothetical protein [Planococcus rifietoensis]|uniref:hypothetical protein n=1 Tax=Planococcus rifietoensis TaxID=200991 RepID=UPI00384F1483
MSIEVNISKSLEKDIGKHGEKLVKDHIKKNGIDTPCPTCGKTIKAKPGNVKCRFCKTTFVLKV